MRKNLEKGNKEKGGRITLGSLFSGAGGFEYAGSLAGMEPLWASEIEPLPIRVTTRRFPGMEHLGNIANIDGGNIKPADVVTFGSPCFPAGTLVLTAGGFIPIEEVAPGMEVLTHKGRWRKVTGAGQTAGPIVSLKEGRHGLECTPSHPIYSCGDFIQASPGAPGQAAFDDAGEWTPAGEMEGRFWAVPCMARPLPIPQMPCSGSEGNGQIPQVSEDLFYFAGRWLMDGWIHSGRKPGGHHGGMFHTICVRCTYEPKEKTLKKAAAAVGDGYWAQYLDSEARISFGSEPLRLWLAGNFGEGIEGRALPGWVFGMREEYRSALLRGIMESGRCGPKDGKGTYEIPDCSKRLAHGIGLLAEMQGYPAAIGRAAGKQCQYTVSIMTGDGGGGIPAPPCRLQNWYRVGSVEDTGRTETVYNITVEEDNSYVADGIVVHNCQNLSIAGNRKGLSGRRSGLFFEAIRVIKEMREATDGKYPKYAVWENVKGALSSNSGRDFRQVIEELCRIRSPGVHVPMPGCRWSSAGEVLGDGFSIAWRVLNAKHWGVPQRRERIFLVADFGGHGAGKVLFGPDRLLRDTEAGKGERGGAARGAEGCAGEAGNGPGQEICLNDQGGRIMDVSYGECATLRAEMHGNVPIVLSNDETHAAPPSSAYSIGNGQFHGLYPAEFARTLDTMHDAQILLAPVGDDGGSPHYIARRMTPLECCRAQGFPDWWMDGLATADPTEEELSWWEKVFDMHREAMKPGSRKKTRNQIRKWLMSPRSDTAEYRMWGNSLAVPCAYHVLAGIMCMTEGRDSS